MANVELARAFSEHRFTDVLPHLHESVVWASPGGDDVTGPEGVERVCGLTADYLAGVETEFVRFRVIEAGAIVVVESEATYTAADGEVDRVASCDLYEFDADGRIAAITSYNVEL